MEGEIDGLNEAEGLWLGLILGLNEGLSLGDKEGLREALGL